MNIFQKFALRISGIELKESQGRVALSFNKVGQPVTTTANFEGLTREGYQKNVMVFACVQKIATACKGIGWELYSRRGNGKPVQIEEHDILKLLRCPNPLSSGADYIEALVAYYLLCGNTYMEANRGVIEGNPAELWILNPKYMKAVPNAKGYVGEWIFQANGITKRFPVNPVTMKGNVQQIKTFHPNDIWYGMSPLEAAILSLDQNNSASKWNLALLQNSSVPSGVLSVKSTPSNPNGTLTKEQIEQTREEIDLKYSGPKNAGRPMLLQGGMEWQAVSLTPKEMDFLNNKKVTSEDICIIYNVPPEIMGLGTKTYQNYKEANAAFYKGTVIPMMEVIKYALNNWLIPMFDPTGSLYLDYDHDDIEALNYDRGEKMKNVDALTYLTQNEKREVAGYETKPGWDVFVIGGQMYSEPDESQGSEDDPNDTPPEDDEDPEADNEGEGKPANKPKSWKTFNLLNKNEKQATLRRINKERARLEKGFQRAVETDFEDMARDLKDAILSSKEPAVIKFALNKVADEHEASLKKTIERHIKFTVVDFGGNTFRQAKHTLALETKAAEKQWETWAKEYVKARSEKAVVEIQGTTKTQIRRIMSKVESALVDGTTHDEIAREMSAEFGNISKSRSTLIARTEVGMASTNSTLEAAKSLQIPKMTKTWVCSIDDRTRDNPDYADHLVMSDVEIDINEKFNVPPDSDMDGPGDNSAGAGQVCNCRCGLVFASRN